MNPCQYNTAMPKLTLRRFFSFMAVRYRLRTLMIALTILPPLLSEAWQIELTLNRPRPVCSSGLRQIGIALHNYYNTPREVATP